MRIMYVLVLSAVITFVIGILSCRRWIKIANRVGIVAVDMNKYDKPKVADMGGIPVIFSITCGILLFSILNHYYLREIPIAHLLAILCSCLIAFSIGLIDDILGRKSGLKKWEKPLLSLLAAVPLMLVVEKDVLSLPFREIRLGLAYSLIVVPVGIVGATNGYNLLAGYNGLEAGMGLIIMAAMTIVGYITSNILVIVVSLIIFEALLAFTYFNWYPARVFPGNAFTHGIGALIGCLAILGNMEFFATILFLPYFLDIILPLRKGLNVEAFGKPNEDGSLSKPYDKIYDLTHLFIVLIQKLKGKVYEKDVTLGILILEIIIASLAIGLIYL